MTAYRAVDWRRRRRRRRATQEAGRQWQQIDDTVMLRRQGCIVPVHVEVGGCSRTAVRAVAGRAGVLDRVKVDDHRHLSDATIREEGQHAHRLLIVYDAAHHLCFSVPSVSLSFSCLSPSPVSLLSSLPTRLHARCRRCMRVSVSGFCSASTS